MNLRESKLTRGRTDRTTGGRSAHVGAKSRKFARSQRRIDEARARADSQRLLKPAAVGKTETMLDAMQPTWHAKLERGVREGTGCVLVASEVVQLVGAYNVCYALAFAEPRP